MAMSMAMAMAMAMAVRAMAMAKSASHLDPVFGIRRGYRRGYKRGCEEGYYTAAWPYSGHGTRHEQAAGDAIRLRADVWLCILM